MSSITIITVGKLKDKRIVGLEEDYLKRFSSFKLSFKELKTEEDVSDELDKNRGWNIFLEEKGEQFSSQNFSQWLFESMGKYSKINFIIGGHAGHHPKALEKKNASFSLGQSTFPHQLARLLLVEQLYRAETIQQGHPYSK